MKKIPSGPQRRFFSRLPHREILRGTSSSSFAAAPTRLRCEMIPAVENRSLSLNNPTSILPSRSSSCTVVYSAAQTHHVIDPSSASESRFFFSSSRLLSLFSLKVNSFFLCISFVVWIPLSSRCLFLWIHCAVLSCPTPVWTGLVSSSTRQQVRCFWVL